MQKKLQIHSVMEIVKIMNRILSVAHDNLMRAQSDMVRQVNCQHCMKNFVIENEVMINTQNLVSDQSTRTLNDKRCELFRILQQFHFFYKFDIPFKWYVIDIFHVSDFIRVVNSK